MYCNLLAYSFLPLWRFFQNGDKASWNSLLGAMKFSSSKTLHVLSIIIQLKASVILPLPYAYLKISPVLKPDWAEGVD